MPPIRLLIAEDHPLMREGIAAVIARQPDMQIVGEAAHGGEAIAQFAALRPDVTLMDLQMPRIDGIQAIEAIRREMPQAKLLVLTTYQGDFQAWRALKAGARGFLVKSALRNTLVDAIRAVHAGNRWVPAEVALDMARHAGDELLTEREIEVLRHIAHGRSNREVGALLSVAEETIKARMKSILQKLDARDRTHAVTIALQRGLIQLYPPARPPGGGLRRQRDHPRKGRSDVLQRGCGGMPAIPSIASRRLPTPSGLRHDL